MVGASRRTGVDDGRRRGRLGRALLLALAASVVVLGVNSVVSTSASTSDAALAYADRVRPAANDSMRQAGALADLRARASELGPTGLRRGVDRLVRDSRRIVLEVDGVPAPSGLRAAHGLLVTCLTVRAQSLATFGRLVAPEGEEVPREQVVDGLAGVGRDLAVADRACTLFLEQLEPRLRETMPGSQWVPEGAAWERPELSAFVATLRASASATPVHDVLVITVLTEPAPVGFDAGSRILPITRDIRLQIVVANAGNAPEKRVTVAAAVTSTGGMDTAREFVDLAAGQRVTVGLRLRPAPPGPFTLRVTVGPVPGEANPADNERTATYVMR